MHKKSEWSYNKFKQYDVCYLMINNNLMSAYKGECIQEKFDERLDIEQVMFLLVEE